MAYKQKASLQAIEDYYFLKGLRGERLRKATQNDREYASLLRKRWSLLSKKFHIKYGDRKRYILSTDQDYEILGKIYRLERSKLSDQDKVVIKLIRTQLEHHWRAPINVFLDQLLLKYQATLGATKKIKS